MYGEETNKGATHWWVYRTMSSVVHPPLFKRIEFDANVERRQARIVIPGVLESTARPIRSPATGGEHRVRISLPNGIEFDLAEIASGTTKTMASIALDLKDSYFHFNNLRQSGSGVVAKARCEKRLRVPSSRSTVPRSRWRLIGMRVFFKKDGVLNPPPTTNSEPEQEPREPAGIAHSGNCTRPRVNYGFAGMKSPAACWCTEDDAIGRTLAAVVVHLFTRLQNCTTPEPGQRACLRRSCAPAYLGPLAHGSRPYDCAGPLRIQQASSGASRSHLSFGRPKARPSVPDYPARSAPISSRWLARFTALPCATPTAYDA